MRSWILAVAGMIALASGQAHAEDAQPACASIDTALPPAMAGWQARTELASAATATALSKAALAPRHAALVTLHHTGEVSYVTQPEKPGGSVSYGGMLELTIAKAGTYQLGLASPAWIDVLKDKAKVVSSAHGHGPACSTVRKVVDFPLQPGRYVLQLSANADPAVAIMIWPRD